MTLRSTAVSRSLDRKLEIAGFEVVDILVIFFLLSVLNFLFGRTGMKLALVWSPTALLALTLRIGKRGKAENYMVHWVRYHLRPKTLPAFSEPNAWQMPPHCSRESSGGQE